MSETKLKPCPFCGSSASVLNVTKNYVLICCDGCMAMMGRHKSEEDIIKSWNKRSGDND